MHIVLSKALVYNTWIIRLRTIWYSLTILPILSSLLCLPFCLSIPSIHYHILSFRTIINHFLLICKYFWSVLISYLSVHISSSIPIFCSSISAPVLRKSLLLSSTSLFYTSLLMLTSTLYFYFSSLFLYTSSYMCSFGNCGSFSSVLLRQSVFFLAFPISRLSSILSFYIFLLSSHSLLLL